MRVMQTCWYNLVLYAITLLCELMPDTNRQMGVHLKTSIGGHRLQPACPPSRHVATPHKQRNLLHAQHSHTCGPQHRSSMLGSTSMSQTSTQTFRGAARACAPLAPPC